MTPYCPVCRKRVPTRRVFSMGACPGATPPNDEPLVVVVCLQCGTAFEETISERLVVKCHKCGGEEFPESDFLYVDGGYHKPVCVKCHKTE